jgi:hypothetical protein
MVVWELVWIGRTGHEWVNRAGDDLQPGSVCSDGVVAQ